MNGYSKIISTKGSDKPRSIDFSDFYSFPPPSVAYEEDAKREKQGNDEGFSKGERFGSVILGRSGSVSSSSSSVKKAFSMRRSSSVSESYCRIHDQYITIASPLANIADHEMDDEDDDEFNNGMRTTTTIRRRRSIKVRGGKIFKACKRLLGL